MKIKYDQYSHLQLLNKDILQSSRVFLYIIKFCSKHRIAESTTSVACIARDFHYPVFTESLQEPLFSKFLCVGLFQHLDKEKSPHWLINNFPIFTLMRLRPICASLNAQQEGRLYRWRAKTYAVESGRTLDEYQSRWRDRAFPNATWSGRVSDPYLVTTTVQTDNRIHLIKY